MPINKDRLERLHSIILRSDGVIIGYLLDENHSRVVEGLHYGTGREDKYKRVIEVLSRSGITPVVGGLNAIKGGNVVIGTRYSENDIDVTNIQPEEFKWKFQI